MRHRPGFPTRQASALICMASLIANVIKASSPRAARKGRTYGRTAPVWGQQRKKVSLTAGSFHIWESLYPILEIRPHGLGFGPDLDHQKVGRKGTRTMTTKATRRHRKQSNLAIKRARKDKRRKARKAAK